MFTEPEKYPRKGKQQSTQAFYTQSQLTADRFFTGETPFP